MDLLMKFSTIAPTLLLSGAIALTTTGCDSKEERERKYLDRAREQIEQGDLVKARLEIRNALQINNQNAEARHLRAMIFEEEQLWRKMMEELDTAVTVDPTYVPAQMMRVKYYYGFGPEADEVTNNALAKILELDPDNAQAIAMMGRVDLRAGNVQAALEHAEAALAADPESIHPYVLFGEIYAGQPDKAMAYIEQGLQANPGNADLLRSRIRVLRQRGDVDAAIAESEQLVKANPENQEYTRELVAYLSENGRVEQAEQFLVSRIASSPEVAEYKVWLMQLLLSVNEPERAVQAAQSFINDNESNPELYYLLSDVYVSLERPQNAIDTLLKLLDSLPKGSAEASTAMVRVADLYLKNGDQDAAQYYLNTVLAKDAENPSALLLSSRILLAKGEIEEAIINLRSALRRDPDSFQARMALAQAHEANGSADLAMDSYQAALELEPSNLQLVLKIAKLFYAQSETMAGDRLLQRYLVTEQSAAAVAPTLVESLVKSQKWGEAEDVSDALQAQESNYALGLYLEGGIFFEQEEYDQAIGSFEKLLEVEPGSARGLSAIVRAKAAQSGPEAALTYLESYASANPDMAAPHELMGGLYSNMGDFPRALDAYDKARALRPDSVNILLSISRAQQASGDVRAAIASLDEARALAPENANLLFLKAGLLESLGEYGEAAGLYEQVLADSPSSVIAANNLAMILVDNVATAEGLKRALEITKDFADATQPVFLDTRAWVLYRAGQYEEARELLEIATSDPQKTIPVYQYHLGMVYAKLGDTVRARQQLEAALASEVEFEGMDEARNTLDNL